MAIGRYTRIDNRRSPSSYWSTVTIVVFVALCLVGVWMMTSSSVVPVQNAEENKNEVKEQSEVKKQVSDSNDGNPQQFEDSQGVFPDDATKGDSNVTSKSSSDVPEKQEEKSSEDTKTGDGDPKTEDRNANTESIDSNSEATENNKGTKETSNKEKPEENSFIQKSDTDDNKKSVSVGSENNLDKTSETKDSGIEEKVEQTTNSESSESSSEKKTDDNVKTPGSNEVFPSGAQSELLNESTTQTGPWSTQAVESKNEKESQNLSNQPTGSNWKLCNATAGPDFIPCLDNWEAIRSLRSTKHYEHRERHCPSESPTCLVPLPEGYKPSIEWPKSRDKIWYRNVPHTLLAEYKGHQNWVKVSGEYLTFPGGGTQFQKGALHYIDFIEQSVPEIGWGKRTRVILDVGCGVASFGGFLFEKDVLTMSFAPKDEHEAQVQFALERGIPAFSAVMGTKRLPFPGQVFDAVHCARCRVPWHIEGGKLLLELNRVLRPGGFFIWSATPIYQKDAENVEIWEAMTVLTKRMCWEAVSIRRDQLNKVAAAIYKKPSSNECYDKRSETEPPMCSEFDDYNAAWNVPLQSCMHKITENSSRRGYQWPEQWPARLTKSPYWLSSSEVGIYGKPGPEDFTADYENWKKIVSDSYLNGIGINWSKVRNAMDMRSVYGGFAAALRDLNIWVMNVVPIDSADTLPLIYERGLFVVEVDRILRPGGKLIVRDKAEMIKELEAMVRSMHWEILTSYSEDKHGFLCAQKSNWRPTEWETLEYAVARPKDLLRDSISKLNH
ncbi:putative methyltransferase PMT26 [Senna tora]|uniref:Putative methyltransferase PMT26 n=1 Tax=Senna tora TaxID=362788 RepID=A0A835CBT1_9FABA|nr:putative methyltransferase PMT26 [Senna tora]